MNSSSMPDLVGELGVQVLVAVLAVRRDEVLGPQQVEQHALVFARGVAGDVHAAALAVDDRGAPT